LKSTNENAFYDLEPYRQRSDLSISSRRFHPRTPPLTWC